MDAYGDPHCVGGAGVDCDRPHRYAPRHELAGLAGARSLQARPRTAATSMCSVAKAANTRHSAYSRRSATIAYPWHPLFGRTLQVAPFRCGKDLKCIYTEERRGFSREVPNWMFDESYCAGMALGPPQVSIDGLNELAVVLKLLGTNQASGARSRPSMKREKGRAEKKPISRADATGSGSESSDSARRRSG